MREVTLTNTLLPKDPVKPSLGKRRAIRMLESPGTV